MFPFDQLQEHEEPHNAARRKLWDGTRLEAWKSVIGLNDASLGTAPCEVLEGTTFSVLGRGAGPPAAISLTTQVRRGRSRRGFVPRSVHLPLLRRNT